jgi:hypothetical protein
VEGFGAATIGPDFSRQCDGKEPGADSLGGAWGRVQQGVRGESPSGEGSRSHHVLEATPSVGPERRQTVHLPAGQAQKRW